MAAGDGNNLVDDARMQPRRLVDIDVIDIRIRTDVDIGERLLMSASSDGGATWSAPRPSADRAFGNGGQPVVQPNGTVIVPFLSYEMESISSTDGGQTWSEVAMSTPYGNLPDHGLPDNGYTDGGFAAASDRAPTD